MAKEKKKGRIGSHIALLVPVIMIAIAAGILKACF